MSKTMPISEVKTRLPELVSGVEEREEEIVVTRNGKPAAVLVNYNEYERLKATLDVLSDPVSMRQIAQSKSFSLKGEKENPSKLCLAILWLRVNVERNNGRLPARYPTARAEIIRHLPLELKQRIKRAIRSLSADPSAGEPLIAELSGLWSFKVRRFRIIYELHRKAGFSGSSPSAIGGKFMSNWRTDCARSERVNRMCFATKR